MTTLLNSRTGKSYLTDETPNENQRLNTALWKLTQEMERLLG